MKVVRAFLAFLITLIILLSAPALYAGESKIFPHGNTPPSAVYMQVAPSAIVNTGALNVRAGPATVYEVRSVLKQGELISLLGRNESASWAFIRSANGVEGWVNAYYLQPNVLIATLPIVAAPPPSSAVGVVNSGALNVRSGPGTSFEVVTVLHGGQIVPLLARNNTGSWIYVQAAAGTKGWVNSSYLETNIQVSSLPVVSDSEPGSPPPQPPENQPYAVVTTGALNFRTGPGTAYPSVAVLDQGQILPLIGRNEPGTWVQVKTSENTAGWVNSSHVQTSIPVNQLPIIEVPPPIPVGIVDTGALNVRTGPSISYEVVTVIRQGQIVQIKGRDGSETWVLVHTDVGANGWVNASYLVINVPISSLPVIG